ncbi:MAG: hypothetical protein JSS86_03175 [Cyanobacteria bacterium SZAS LIN-2]|nr:hypothetical protein [Cyanobacteria bacterium SZAS LIN-3]MBS1995280.1 hypothetical protein [Cyanobacteria bacterium SZAS LIN-2]
MKKVLKNQSCAAFLACLGSAGLLLGPAGPALSQEQQQFQVRERYVDPDASPIREQIAVPVESRPVHSKSAETPAIPPATAKQSSAQAYDQSAPPSTMTLKAGASYTVPRGTSMSLKVTAASPKMGMKLLEKDLEGNPIPARVGDVISAMITEDIYVDGDRVIPEGTVFRGHVSYVHGPRRVQRPGWVDIKFDELELPNHRIFRFKAQADSLQPSTTRGKLRATGMVAANMAGGAIVGAITAYQVMGGMRTAVALHGYNVAGGAALGAVLAGTHAIMKRGHSAWLEPGDGLNLAIDTDMVMPALQAPTKHTAIKTNLEGVYIKVNKSKCIKDGIGGWQYRMDVNITNDSNETLQAIDLYLVDSNGTKNPLSMGPEGDEGSSFLFRLEPNTSLRSIVYFASEHPKLNHQFVWYNHQTRRVCYRQPVELKPYQ